MDVKEYEYCSLKSFEGGVDTIVLHGAVVFDVVFVGRNSEIRSSFQGKIHTTCDLMKVWCSR